MGQSWEIVNLDKRQRYWRGYGGGKLGEFLCCASFEKLFWLLAVKPKDSTHPAFTLDQSGPWAGDRIMCVGGYVEDYPEGLLTEDELKELNGGDKGNGKEDKAKDGGNEDKDGDEEDEDDIRSLYHLAAFKYTTADVFGIPRTTYFPGYPWVLRNLSKREYVNAEAIELTGEASEESWVQNPAIESALLCRICWSSDPSISLGYEPLWPGTRPLHRGIWAGDRFDIISSSDFDGKREGWEDVSNEVRQEVFEIWATDLDYGTVNAWKTRASVAKSALDPPFPRCSLDIQRYIMEITAKKEIMDALSLARVSKLTNAWMTPIIYKSIVMTRSKQLRSFLDTLQLKPELGSNLRRLFFSHAAKPVGFKAALECCTRLEYLITNVKLETMAPYEEQYPAKTPWPVLRNVMAVPGTKILPPKKHPLLSKVTHLYIDFQELDVLTTLSSDALPHLTHLAVFFSPRRSYYQGSIISSPEAIEDLLQSYSSLSVVLLIPHDEHIPGAPLTGARCAEFALIEDKRVLARRGLDVDDYKNIMRYGASLFANAESKYKNWRHAVSPPTTVTNP